MSSDCQVICYKLIEKICGKFTAVNVLYFWCNLTKTTPENNCCEVSTTFCFVLDFVCFSVFFAVMWSYSMSLKFFLLLLSTIAADFMEKICLHNEWPLLGWQQLQLFTAFLRTPFVCLWLYVHVLNKFADIVFMPEWRDDTASVGADRTTECCSCLETADNRVPCYVQNTCSLFVMSQVCCYCEQSVQSMSVFLWWPE